MIRLYVVCEGQTEVRFASDGLAPLLGGPGLCVMNPPNLRGYTPYARVRKLIRSLLRGEDAYVTTMIDLYRLPSSFPSFAASEGIEDPYRRVEALETALADDIANDHFIPYLQLHEFEALILADLNVLGRFYPTRAHGLQELKADLDRRSASPEEVDLLRPPSHRIREYVPEYEKTVSGPAVALEIGLQRLHEKCRHFGAWLDRLGQLRQTPP